VEHDRKRAEKEAECDRKCAEKEAERDKRDKANAIAKAKEKEREKERKWEEPYTEFERCMEMPAKCSKLLFWKQNQLGNGPTGFNAMIQKEIAENKGSTIWTDRKARLLRA
jgi:hypothetical protein